MSRATYTETNICERPVFDVNMVQWIYLLKAMFKYTYILPVIYNWNQFSTMTL